MFSEFDNYSKNKKEKFLNVQNIYLFKKKNRNIKKSLNTEQKRMQEKLKRDRGEAYVSKNGLVKLAKRMKDGCTNCRYGCQQINDIQRKKIFDNYYRHGSLNLQWQYIATKWYRVINLL